MRVLGALARHLAGRKAGKPILHIARDGQRLATLEEALQFFAPDVKRLSFPPGTACPTTGWRQTPRPSPGASRRSPSLPSTRRADETPLIVLTTVNAVLQRVPPREFIAASMQPLAPATW